MCDYYATRKDNLKLHVKFIHQNKEHKFSICEYSTSQQNTLKLHVESIDLNKNYNCNMCDYTAISKTYLKKGILILFIGKKTINVACEIMFQVRKVIGNHILKLFI